MTTAYEAAMAARDAAKDAEAAFLRQRQEGKKLPLLLTLLCQHQARVAWVHLTDGHQILYGTFQGRVVAPDSPSTDPDGVIVAPGEPDPDKGTMTRYRREANALPSPGLFDSMTTYDLESECCTVRVPLVWLREQLRDTTEKRRVVVPIDR